MRTDNETRTKPEPDHQDLISKSQILIFKTKKVDVGAVLGVIVLS